MKPKRIGYSCWGFLGNGIVDTPDGGRSHRITLIKALLKRGHQVIMLQQDRDLLEANELIRIGQTYDLGFPEIDVLFLEWRWLIPGRNDDPSREGYTPDLDRQRELLRYYGTKVPIVVWDKDQKLYTSPEEDRKLLLRLDTYVLEPSLYPSAPDRTRCLFPVDFSEMPRYMERGARDIPLIYIGNQYERDDAYYKYLVDAARYIDVHVYGKWPRASKTENLYHHGRIGFSEVARLYRRAVATVLLAPSRYMRTGQFTQRIFESIRGGCLPLVPEGYRGSHLLFSGFSRVSSGFDIATRISDIRTMEDVEWRKFVEEQIVRLWPFDIHFTLKAIEAAANRNVPRFQDLPPIWVRKVD